MKTRIFLLAGLFLICLNVSAQKVRALFIGNSYTYSNSLPQIIYQMAASTGDTLYFDSSTPGGYTFKQHTTNPASTGLIQQGGWDFVVLQEQSQLPSFPDHQVATMVYPYAAMLDSMIRASNHCASTLFFMTWGRKNGDSQNCASFPPVCTYQGMDSLLQLRYTIMAQTNEAALAPVAKVWRRIRNNYPDIELYSPDGSHPSTAGSFAAACTFYTIMFGKNPAAAPFNYTIPAAEATIIKNVAKEVVFDSLPIWYKFDHHKRPLAAFLYEISGNSVSFTNLSKNADSYLWHFGDGNTSTQISPVYTYQAPGPYETKLIASEAECNKKNVAIQTINIVATGIDTDKGEIEKPIFPNPATTHITLKPSASAEKLIIYDMYGREISSILCTHLSEEMTVDIRSLSAGMYQLVIVSKTNPQQSVRFIKE